MKDDEVRARTQERIASEEAEVTTSTLARRAKLVLGLTKAGAKSIGRAVRRAGGGVDEDLAPEIDVARSFGELKGVVTKVGQMLGYVDVGLPETLRSALSALHTDAPRVDVRGIRKVLEEDLGDRGRELGMALDPKPLSSASVGQVHRARLPDGTNVVVKVLHPALEEVIERDFAPAMFASRVSSSLHATVAEVRGRLLEECNYSLEAERQSRFATIFDGDKAIVVPRVHRSYGSRRILTTTFVDGIHLDALLASSPSEDLRNRVGEALFDFYVAPLFLHGIYVADPHPGNYLFLPDGRVAFVDFGCVGEVDFETVARVSKLMRSVLDDDAAGAARALAALGMAAHRPDDREAIAWLLRTFARPLVRDEVVAFDVAGDVKVRDVVRRLWSARRIAASGELVFLLRTVLGLGLVLSRIGARSNWRKRLEPVVVHAEERRSLAPPPLSFEEGARAEAASAMPRRPAQRAASIELPSEPRFDVVLVDAGPGKIGVLRELRELLSKDLRELSEFVDSVPQTLRGQVPRDEAEILRTKLEGLGARVDLRRVEPRV